MPWCKAGNGNNNSSSMQQRYRTEMRLSLLSSRNRSPKRSIERNWQAERRAASTPIYPILRPSRQPRARAADPVKAIKDDVATRLAPKAGRTPTPPATNVSSRRAESRSVEEQCRGRRLSKRRCRRSQRQTSPRPGPPRRRRAQTVRPRSAKQSRG